MDPSTSPETLGHQLGSEAVDNVVRRAEEYCQYQQSYLELSNQPKILARRAEFALLREQEAELKERVRLAPAPGDLRSRQRRSVYYWAVAISLAVAGYFFSLLALAPYRFGWMSYLYALGIAIVVPFCVDKFLEVWGNRKLFQALSAVALVTAISSLILLALIRGDVIAQQIGAVSPVITFGNEHPGVVQSQGDFYKETQDYLKLMMALLAVAMEIGSGLALHDARRLGLNSGEDPVQLRNEVALVQQQMVSQIHEISYLLNEPAFFVAQFWRDFHRAMLNGTVRSALTKFSILILLFLTFATHPSLAAEPLHLVIAVDLSKSVAIQDHSNRGESEKNFTAVTRILATLPADSRVTIIGITANSFAQPYILLEAQLDEDEGFFKERLAAGRQRLVEAWQERRKQLQPDSLHTDVFGALLVASELFQRTPGDRKVLVLFSDMRHETSSLDLETPRRLAVNTALASVEAQKLLPDLDGIEIYALGVHSAGRQVNYWQGLRAFWTAYFRQAGASLKRYSILRDPPNLSQVH